MCNTFGHNFKNIPLYIYEILFCFVLYNYIWSSSLLM